MRLPTKRQAERSKHVTDRVLAIPELIAYSKELTCATRGNSACRPLLGQPRYGSEGPVMVLGM
jgi:hypothetical protein